MLEYRATGPTRTTYWQSALSDSTSQSGDTRARMAVMFAWSATTHQTKGGTTSRTAPFFGKSGLKSLSKPQLMDMRRPLVSVKLLLPSPHPLRLHQPLLQTMGGPPLHLAHSLQQPNKTVMTQEKNSTTRESTRVRSIVVNLSPTFPFTHRPSMPLQNYSNQHPPQAAAAHPRTWITRPPELSTSPSSSSHFWTTPQPTRPQ